MNSTRTDSLGAQCNHLLGLTLRVRRRCSWGPGFPKGRGEMEGVWAMGAKSPGRLLCCAGSSILILQRALKVEVLKSCTELFAWYFLPPRTGSSSEAQEGAALGRFPA